MRGPIAALLCSAAAAAAAVAAVSTTAAVAMAAAAEAPAAAQPSAPASPSIPVRGVGSCPAPAAVWAELGTLIPPARLDARLAAAGGAGAPIEVFDLGPAYRVVAGGPARDYRDDARDCAERARVAALFIGLAIDPSLSSPLAAAAPVAAPSPAPVVAKPAAPPAPPPPPAPAEARVRLLVGGAADAGLPGGGAAGVVHGGASLRVVARAGRLPLSVGALALLPVETTVGDVRLRQWRLPADASLRASATVAGGGLHPFGELGLGVTLVTARALDAVAASTRAAFEVGARAAVGLQIGGGRGAPFLALHGQVVPRPAEVSLLPRGVVGHTPNFWLGASAGLSVGLF